jgi:NADP-dependent 3-hydroxy acid dehydrogenase YdfG
MADDYDKVFGEWPYLFGEDISDAILYLLSTKPHVNVSFLSYYVIKDLIIF